MIRGALTHLPGIGPRRLELLEQAGIRTWQDILSLSAPPLLAGEAWERIVKEVKRCENALAREDLPLLLDALATSDHWRILAHGFEKATFFDIETSGLGQDSYITVISCYHRERLEIFIKDVNLTGFLELLDDVDLLISFNGAAFDVPRVEQAFHIPALPCPHLDLRWVCYHEGLTGSLKSIETGQGITRPKALIGMDGEEAVRLWACWEEDGDKSALDKLIRYAAADVLALKVIAARLLERRHCPVAFEPARDIWRLLPDSAGVRGLPGQAAAGPTRTGPVLALAAGPDGGPGQTTTARAYTGPKAPLDKQALKRRLRQRLRKGTCD